MGLVHYKLSSHGAQKLPASRQQAGYFDAALCSYHQNMAAVFLAQ